MKDRTFKQTYAFVLLALMILWAIVVLAIITKCALNGEVSFIDLFVASGLSALLGWFMAKNGDITQFYFRKGYTDPKDAVGTDKPTPP